MSENKYTEHNEACWKCALILRTARVMPSAFICSRHSSVSGSAYLGTKQQQHSTKYSIQRK